MYHRKNDPNRCGYHRIQSIANNKNSDKEERKAALAKAYRVDVEELDAALRRVVAVVCLNEYFRYVYGKDLLEAKQKELLALKIDVERYMGWKQSSKKVKFALIQEAIDFILNNLK